MYRIPKPLIDAVETSKGDLGNAPNRTENIRLANHYALEAYRVMEADDAKTKIDQLIQLSIMHSLLTANQ